MEKNKQRDSLKPPIKYTTLETDDGVRTEGFDFDSYQAEKKA